MRRTRLPAGAKHTTKTIICIQLTVTLIAAATFMVAIDVHAAYSAAVGGTISIIATLYFAVHVFSAGIGASPDTVARTFYFGEAVKIGLSILLFAIAILWLDVSFLPLMLTYIATLAAYWLALPFSIDTVGKTR